MSFIRPEAGAALWRWREALVSAAMLALGLYWALGSGGLLRWLGCVLLIVAGMGIVAGVQRARFRMGRDGPGVVSIDEGQVTYFGPLEGGSVALGELALLELDRASRPPVWRLSEKGRSPLHIPLTAEGADNLFDAFARLPGLRTESMLKEMHAGASGRVVIWRRDPLRLH